MTSPAEHAERTQRHQVAAEAMTWLNTPYHHHARVKGVGVDCAQLLCAVFEACQLVEPIQPGYYPIDWHLHRGEELFSAWAQRYATLCDRGQPLQVGDVLLFQFGRTYSHGSIVVATDPEPLVIHSYLRLGVCLGRLSEQPLAGHNLQHWSPWPQPPPKVLA